MLFRSHDLASFVDILQEKVGEGSNWIHYGLTSSDVVEFVFNYQGIGRLMVGSVYNRDIPVVQACALIFASTYVILNLLADLIGIISNPRLLYPK